MTPSDNALTFFLDIETTAVLPGAGVWQIGAVARIPSSLGGAYRSVFIRDIKLEHGAIKDPATMAWLADNDLMGAYTKSQNSGIGMAQALEELNSWANMARNQVPSNTSEEPQEMWCSWGTFDFPLTGYWVDQLQLPRIWSYRDEVDLRGATRFMDPHQSRMIRPASADAHNALADAEALIPVFDDLKNILHGEE